MPTTESSNILITPGARPEFIDASDPRGPWRARRDWASGDLYFNAGTHFGVYVMLFVGLVMLAVGFAFAYHLYDELVSGTYRAGDWGALLPIVIFGFTGILMTVVAARAVIQGLKWRGSHFHLASVPIPIGGPLRGELRTSRPIAAGHKVWFKIECVSVTEQAMRASDGTTDYAINRSTIWEDEETVISDGSGTIPIAFAIPADARQTRAPGKSRNDNWSIEWQLTVQEVGGGREGYTGDFDLPVFSIPVTAEQKAEVESIRAGRTKELEEYQPGADFGVRITRTADGGTEFFFPPVRGGAKAIPQTVVFLGTIGLLAAICIRDQPSIPLVAIWGFVDLGFFMWILRLWFAPERVVFANGAVSYTYGILGKTRTMPIADISSIHVVKGGYTTHNAIRIKGHGLNMFDVGDGIRVKRNAEWLARQMSTVAGVKPVDSIPGSSQAEFLEQAEAVNAFVKKFTGKDVLGKALSQKVAGMMKDAGGAPAANLPPGVADMVSAMTKGVGGTPPASAPAYGNDEAGQNALAEDIARKAFGLTPRELAEEAQANPMANILRSAARIRTAESIPVSVPSADPQAAIAEKLAREAFGIESEPIRKIPTTSPIRLVFKFVGPLILLLGMGVWARFKSVVQVVAHNGKVVYVSDAQNGRTLDVPQGDTLRIVLPISPGTGVWSITENDPAFLAPRGTVLPTAPASVGQSEVLLFSAVKKGTAYLRLDSSLQPDGSRPTGTFRVRLVIN
jgi:hypothetical protein